MPGPTSRIPSRRLAQGTLLDDRVRGRFRDEAEIFAPDSRILSSRVEKPRVSAPIAWTSRPCCMHGTPRPPLGISPRIMLTGAYSMN